MSDRFRLTLESTDVTAPVMALLRRHLDTPMSSLREAIAGGQPFLDETPHHNVYTEFVQRVTRLVDELEAAGIPYRVEIDGSPESPEYLRNVFQRWHDLRQETRRMIDLESGE